ncbi:hypothetical protein B0919_04035 [Hymenobacter sp. CRA2]|nr:hypothetical protein B0919_04035 [Hymenobacter sp. CRA2]
MRTVCARLYAEGCNEIISLHDAIYCPADQVDHVYSTIMDEYRQRSMTPQVKIKVLVEPIIADLCPAR